MLKTLPPDLAESIGSISLTFEMERSLVTELPAIQSWYVHATAHHWDDEDDEGNPRAEGVALIHIVRGSLVDGSLWDQLDAMEADLETVGSSILDSKRGDLREEVEEFLEAGTGSNLLILNSVTLDTRWRGYGVGAFLAGEAIEALSDDSCCVATYPAPFDGSTGKAREATAKKLRRVWESLGFKQFDERVWILDPGMVYLGDALARMRANFGIS